MYIIKLLKIIQAIEKKYHSVIDDCFTVMLSNSRWLKHLTLEDTELVEKLMEVLSSREVDHEDVAKNVEANWGKHQCFLFIYLFIYFN